MFAIQLIDKYYEKKNEKGKKNSGNYTAKSGEEDEQQEYKSVSPTNKKTSPKKPNKLESMFKGLTMMKSKSKEEYVDESSCTLGVVIKDDDNFYKNE